MNKFYSTVGALAILIIGSVSATVFYIHNQQNQDRIKQNISDVLNDIEGVENSDDTLSNLDLNLTDTDSTANESSPTPTSKTQTSSQTNTTKTTPTSKPSGLTTGSVGQHSSKTNCWIIISSNVYDVTKFLSIHPGGVTSITPYCGKDATNAFNSNSVGHNHSSYARSLLPTYFVGAIGSTNTQTVNQNPTTQSLTSAKFSTGDIVKLSSDVNVRSSANTSGTLLGQQISGATGTIVSGPVSQGGFNWWKINYDFGVDGWSIENYLSKYTKTPSVTPTSSLQTTPTPTQNQSNNYTSSQVATHNSQNNCWIIISNSIYDVTSFLSIHPGGVGIIVQYCGKDATLAFTSNSAGHSHSSYAKSLLPTYFVSNLFSLTPTPTITLTPTPTPTPTPTSTPTPTPNQQSSTYTTQTVATHNAQSNCWIIISNSIYNVTSFLSIHPGGVSSIVQYCGQDATNAFNSNSVGHNHSSYARSLLPTYFLGNIGSVVTPTPTPTATPSTTPTPTPAPTPTPTPTQSSSGGFTASDVATHNTQSNCWIIISGKIYDATSFMSIHPGGVSTIRTRCGTDVTTVFNTGGGGGHNHSSYARSLLPTYYVADVTTQTSLTPTPTGSSTPTPTPTPTNINNPTTHTVSVTSNGTISPSSLTINAGDTVMFNYVSSNGEAYLSFSPSIGTTIKLDEENSVRSFTFNSTGSWTYHKTDGGVTNATITAQ